VRNNRLFYAVAFFGLALATPAFAATTTELNAKDAAALTRFVSDNGLSCTGCHAIDHKVVGPAWFAVAQKYHGQKNAKTLLENRIANGGSRTWGSIPMPPDQATKAQAKKLAGMILALDAAKAPANSLKTAPMKPAPRRAASKTHCGK